MSRPRSNILKVGDKVSYKEKEGVVVFVDHVQKKPYSVHFSTRGSGLFNFKDLKKVNPTFKAYELIDEDVITPKETIDA